ncbi:MAG: hypothetical protein RLZZ148_1715 [Cyanobacteriota bacterium]
MTITVIILLNLPSHSVYGESIMSIAHQNPPRPGNTQAKVKTLNAKKPRFPNHVIVLMALEKAMSGVALTLLAGSLGFYAWTVYLPKLWSREYQKLETLQRHERQIIATNESLKHQLAQQAEKPETGLTNPQPAQSIFIPSAKTEKSSVIKPDTKTEEKPPAPMVSQPMGY